MLSLENSWAQSSLTTECVCLCVKCVVKERLGGTEAKHWTPAASPSKSASCFQTCWPTGSPSRLEDLKTQIYDVINSSASSSQTVYDGVKTELPFHQRVLPSSPWARLSHVYGFSCSRSLQPFLDTSTAATTHSLRCREGKQCIWQSWQLSGGFLRNWMLQFTWSVSNEVLITLSVLVLVLVSSFL